MWARHRHATWLRPNGPGGFVDDQAGLQLFNASWPLMMNETIDAAVVVERGEYITATNCTFRHLGGTAVHLQAGTRHSVVAHSSFYDISASAVMIGEVLDWAQTNETLQTLNNTVSDSTAVDLPKEFHGAVALSVLIAASTSLLHNEVGGSSYSAISVGWGWHTPVGNSSYARQNKVFGNYIHDSLQLLFDGGDIYTLGSQVRPLCQPRSVWLVLCVCVLQPHLSQACAPAWL